jgi:hypothetical protein
MKSFDELCSPAKLYFILSVIACIAALINGVKFGQVIVNLIVAFIWTAVLSWICGKGFTGVSLLLVFFKLMKDISSSQVMVVVPPSTTQQMRM